MASIAGEDVEMEDVPSSSQASPSKSKPKKEERAESPLRPDEKPFEGYTVAVVGKLSKTMAEFEKVVKEHGGGFAKTITKAVNMLVTNDLEVCQCLFNLGVHCSYHHRRPPSTLSIPHHISTPTSRVLAYEAKFVPHCPPGAVFVTLWLTPIHLRTR